MSLLDQIITTTVGMAMASNKGLSKITSTTYSQTGTSLGSVQTSAFTAANTAVGGVSANSILYGPIGDMTAYASSLSTDPSQIVAINNAGTTAQNSVDSYYSSNTPSFNGNVFDVQNIASQSVTFGINSFGNSLAGINPQIVNSVLNLGNNSLVSNFTALGNVCTNAYSSAVSSVANSVTGINASVAALVNSSNSAASAISGLTTGGASAAAATAADPFATAGTTTITETPVSSALNNTDVIYQEIKLYIEGVQIPFSAISISQGVGNLPTASVEVPPQAGLMDIARYYQPKVHVFFTDTNIGGDRLLFVGHIIAVNYTKSQQDGRASITFQCDHKNALLDLLTLEFSNGINNVTIVAADPASSQPAVQVNSFNSQESLVAALKGLTGLQTLATDLIDPSNTAVPTADVTKLSQRFKNFENRLVGMPSAMMNMWNQLKVQCFSHPALNTIMSSMYIPLLENGLGFFDRLAGHYVLENLVDSSKEPPCPGIGTANATSDLVLVPPSHKLNTISAISSTIASKNLTNLINFSGEMTTFMELFSNFFGAIEYEIVTLASPAEVPADATANVNFDSPSTWTNPKMAIETVVKPQIPLYYSPICNVVFPKMFHSIQISQSEISIPTRIAAYSDLIPGSQGNLGSQYRAPNSIREAVSIGVGLANSANGTQLSADLLGTTGGSYNVPGKYEQGRGVKNQRTIMPQWLAMLVKDTIPEINTPNSEALYAKGTTQYKALCDLHAAWIARYGYDTGTDANGTPTRTRNVNKDNLDPYSDKAGIHPFQRLLFAAADYDYTKQVVGSRSGSLDGVFNPYIVPGYPMEILDDSPNHPCFHAMCASVTHTFTSRSIGTSIGFMGASTYTEMVNYFMQPLHPWLQTALDLVNTTPGASGVASDGADGYNEPPADIVVNSTIINNAAGKAMADKFYKNVFGVGAADINTLYNFQYGQLLPVARQTGLLAPGSTTSTEAGTGREMNDFFSTVGNLRLVMRAIEGKNSIQDKFNIKFIDFTPANYSSTMVAYQNPQLASPIQLEPGASLFLDYQEVSDFIGAAKLSAKTPSTATSASTTPIIVDKEGQHSA